MNYPNYFGNYFPQLPTNEKLYVQGEAGAQAYLVSANNSVVLWDSTRNVFYEKKADATGRPSLVAYEYKQSDLNAEEDIGLKNVIKSLQSRVDDLEDKIKGVLNDEPTTVDE